MYGGHRQIAGETIMRNSAHRTEFRRAQKLSQAAVIASTKSAFSDQGRHCNRQIVSVRLAVAHQDRLQ